MKICLLNFDGGPTLEAIDSRTGGLHVTLFNLSKAISMFLTTKITIIWRADGKTDKSLKELQNKGIKLIKIKAGPERLLPKEILEEILPEFTEKVAKYLRRHKFDIIYTSGSEAGLVIATLRGWEFLKSTIWVHKNYATLAVRRVMVDGMSVDEAVSDRIGQREKMVLHKCDHIIASTSIDKKEIEKVFDIEKSKISVISPGLDHSIFKPPQFPNERPPLVISAGRMAKIKDWPFLLRAFKKVVENNTDNEQLLLIIIGGSKKERDKLGLSEIVRKLDIQNFVSFVDSVPQQEVLAKYFQIGRVFIGASRHETFGRLPVEARACGAPFVVRANSSYLATAKDGEGGYFANNEEEMAKKITEILRLPFQEWQKLSQLAYESAKKFSWEKSALEHLQLFQSLFKKRATKYKMG